MARKTKTAQLPTQHLEFRFEPTTLNEEARTVDLVWTTGARVRRRMFFGEDFDEELALETDNVRLDRLNNGANLLNSHMNFHLSAVLGVVERAWIQGPKGRREGRATVRFSSREDVEPVFNDVREGIIRNVSVGYRIHGIEKTDRKDNVPLMRVIDWEPMELSMVSVPADAGAQVRSESSELFPVTIHQREEESVMADRTDAAAGAASTPDPEGGQVTVTSDQGTVVARTEAPAGDTGSAPANHVLTIRTETASASAEPAVVARQPLSLSVPDNANLDAERESAAQGERDRITYIQTQVQRFSLDAEIGETLIKDGTDVESSRVRILDEVAKVHPANKIGNTVVSATDNREADMYTGIRGALLHRYDPTHNPIDDNARRFRGLSLIEIARHCLVESGFARQIQGMARHKVAGLAMMPGYGEGVRAMHTTSDFANVLADVANKTLRDAYEQSPRTFQPFCRRVTAVDFKGINRVALSEAPALEKVNEHGEFRSGVMSDTKETYALGTYGKIVGITRQVIVNDDLDAFTRVPQLFGSAAAQKESDIVYFVILNNANQADGTPLFDANHGNLAASGGAISVTTVGAGRTSMAKQTGIDGTTLINVTPRYMVVPSDLETVAQQFLSQSLMPATTANVVPEQLRSSLTPLAEPRLGVGVTLDGTTAAGSLTAWYLAADPSTIDTIEYAFLEGEEGVSIETKNGFEVDGVQVRARLDFAAKAIDHRGLYKNAGA